MTQPRAVLYARVSGDDRATDGRNLEGQLDLCRKHAQDQGWTVVAELAEDVAGVSGAVLYPPQLEVALKMAADGLYDYLVVREVDRLSRDMTKFHIVKQELSKSGVEVRYVLYMFPDDPMGRYMERQYASIAELERDLINARMTRGRRLKAKSGQVLNHSITLYGYRHVEVDGRATFEVDEAAARVIRLIFDLYVNEGLSTYKIQRRLTEMRVPTPADRGEYAPVTKKRGYGEWSRTTVNRIVKRRAYTGVWEYGKSTRGDVVEVPIPAIISQETWEAAQERVRNSKQSPKNLKRKYLLAGRLSCAVCNAYGKSIPAGRWLYYRCGASSEPLAYVRDCNQPHFPAKRVDEAVWSWLERVLEPAEFERALESGEDAMSMAAEPLVRRLATVDDLIHETQRKLERLVTLFVHGNQYTAELFQQQQEELVDSLEALKRERASLDAELTDVRPLPREVKQELRMVVADLATRGELTFEERRRVVEQFDVRGRLEEDEEGTKWVHVTCVVASASLSL